MRVPLGVSSRFPWGFFVCTPGGFLFIPLGVFCSYPWGFFQDSPRGAPPKPVEQGENDCTTRVKMSAEQGENDCTTRVNVVHPNHNI